MKLRFFCCMTIVGGLTVSTASAVSITNGTFEADAVSFGSCPETTPTGWTGGVLCGMGYYGATGDPDGGGAFAIIGGGTDFPTGSLSQTITGLTTGHNYTVSFYLAGENWFISTTEQVMVSMLSGSSTGSQTYDAPHSSCNGCDGNTGLWDHWSLFNYTFLATGTSATIKFADIFSDRNDTGIDKISIAETTSSVPEPGTIGLLCLGMGSLGLLRRRIS